VAIDFTLSPEIENVRDRVRDFIQNSVRPTEEKGDAAGWGRDEWLAALGDLRAEAQERGLWLPHMPAEWGGMGLSHVAMATVSA
jgi:acyl-CoA dehydrogenase